MRTHVVFCQLGDIWYSKLHNAEWGYLSEASLALMPMVCGCVEVKTESLLTENVWDTFMRIVGRSER
jgi:hypothetical protein